MSHNAIQMVSPANTSKSRMTLITSVLVQRTWRTFRLLPLPGSMVLDTTASLQDLLRGQQAHAVPQACRKTSWFRLEVEAHFRRKCSRGYVVSAAERREEVIQCVLVCDVYARQAQTPSVPVTFEDVVFANGGVEEIARSNALWVLVVVSCIRGRDVDQVGGQLCCRADARKRSEWSGPDAVADKTSLSFLISGERLAEGADHLDGRLPIQRGGGDEAGAVGVCNTVAGGVARHQAAVIPPVETDPGLQETCSRHLILHMRGLVEALVMVDTEGEASLADS